MKIFRYTFLIALIVISCTEDGNMPAVNLGIIPTVAVDPAAETLDVNNRATTAVRFTLNYNNFGGDLTARTINIYVASGTAINSTLSFANTALVKSVNTFPSDVSVSLAEMCTALGLNINTVGNNRSFELFFELITTSGVTFRDGTNIHPNVNNTIDLGYYKYRFFTGCKTGVEDGYYKATLSGSNPKGLKSESEVIIARQQLNLDAPNLYLNFLRDMFSISDVTAGFYPQSGLNPSLIAVQPMGIRDLCGTFTLFNTALNTFPSPGPQITFTAVSGNWNAATRTLTVTWTDATNGVTETTTFVKVRDL